MLDKHTAAAAILGTLVPELQYAAPVLLDRLNAGLPLTNRKSPSGLGFETGMIEVDLFRALAPYVDAALGYGILGLIQTWLLNDRGAQSVGELREALNQIRSQNADLRRVLDSIRTTLSAAAKVPVTQNEVDEAIADAIARVVQERL